MGNNVTFTNRYGDLISFLKTGDWTIRMIGGEYFRYAFRTEAQFENKQYGMVDPSGGPNISSGSDMGRFAKEWKGLIVKHISPLYKHSNGEHIIHLFEGRMMKGTTNGEDELRWYQAGDSSGDFESFNDMEQFLVSKL